MNLYTKDQISKIYTFIFSYIEWIEKDHVLTITLNRPTKKNALHPQMINELVFCLQYANEVHDIWVVVIRAKGDIFCAGADLKAMAGDIEENDSTIPIPSKDVLLGEVFNQVNKPTIALVSGDVYAGGFFFLAGCQFVIARDDVKFGLPEVKRGLFPFQVMTALMRVIPERKVLDWCIRGYNLPVREALSYGLVTAMAKPDNLESVLNSLIVEIKGNSPTAIRYGLQAYHNIRPSGGDHKYLFDMLQKTIKSGDGQEGLRAFREKRKPKWTGE